jgi:hypothetical protein
MTRRDPSGFRSWHRPDDPAVNGQCPPMGTEVADLRPLKQSSRCPASPGGGGGRHGEFGKHDPRCRVFCVVPHMTLFGGLRVNRLISSTRVEHPTGDTRSQVGARRSCSRSRPTPPLDKCRDHNIGCPTWTIHGCLAPRPAAGFCHRLMWSLDAVLHDGFDEHRGSCVRTPVTSTRTTCWLRVLSVASGMTSGWCPEAEAAPVRRAHQGAAAGASYGAP